MSADSASRLPANCPHAWCRHEAAFDFDGRMTVAHCALHHSVTVEDGSVLSVTLVAVDDEPSQVVVESGDWNEAPLSALILDAATTALLSEALAEASVIARSSEAVQMPEEGG